MKKSEAGLAVHTKAVDVACGFLPSCITPAGSAAEFVHGCCPIVVSVWISSFRPSVLLLSLSRRCNSNAAGAIPGEADVVDLLTPVLS